jgi:hypothetical protein
LIGPLQQVPIIPHSEIAPSSGASTE